jgi:hypothetical protein
MPIAIERPERDMSAKSSSGVRCKDKKAAPSRAVATGQLKHPPAEIRMLISDFGAAGEPVHACVADCRWGSESEGVVRNGRMGREAVAAGGRLWREAVCGGGRLWRDRV